MKNTLATVQSIARQTVGRSAFDTAVKDAFEARLLALSRAHNVLTAQSWESVDLKDIVAEAMSPFEIGGRVTATGPSVRLAPRQGLTLAMALHELVTNAAKHGALAGARGQVAIGWTVEHGVLDLAWTETGGPPVTAPTRRGFGSRLLEQGLPRELKAQAQLSFPGAGAAYRLKVPLADPTGAASVFSPLAAAHERA